MDIGQERCDTKERKAWISPGLTPAFSLWSMKNRQQLGIQEGRKSRGCYSCSRRAPARMATRGRHTEAAITFLTDFFHCDCSSLFPCRPTPPLTCACSIRVALPLCVDTTAGSTGPTEKETADSSCRRRTFPCALNVHLLQCCHRLADRPLTRGLWEWFLDAPKASDGRGCRDI